MSHHPSNDDPRRLPGLRSRYLRLAASRRPVTAAATLYMARVGGESARAHHLRDNVMGAVAATRDALQAADAALTALVLTPRPRHEEQARARLDAARRHLAELQEQVALTGQAGLAATSARLDRALRDLQQEVTLFIERRHDPNWVYPILPYIAERLLQPNIAFETAADEALQAIAERDGRHYGSELYGRFDRVRDLWRRKILNFRAVIIRFAGLNDIETTAQEVNVDQLHEVIAARLDELSAMAERGELGLVEEDALRRMREASSAWQANWQTVKKLRSTAIWRNDLHLLETRIRPLQQQLHARLGELEHDVLAWSAGAAAATEAAARRVIYTLWALVALALAFVVLAYLMLDRWALGPIARIAETLNREGDNTQYTLAGQGSREVQQLVQAFNTMRQIIHQRQTALEHQALHDGLTGLPNRTLLHDRLENAIHIMRRNKAPVALLLLDLDRFKEVNDTLGHPVGDQLLQEVGRRLHRLLRESDTVARLGGDEFAIVAPDTGADQALAFAAKIHEALCRVFTVDGQNLYVGVSIGISVYPLHGADPDELIRRADIAMYVAKRGALGQALYDPSQDEHSPDRLALVGDLHRELENPQHLFLAYQPQIDLFTREVVGVEALLRWDNRDSGPVPPEEVIQLAEHTGLIDRLTDWVLDTALADCARCRELVPGLSMAINLSTWNLQDPDLPQRVSAALARHGVPAEQLILEVTESAMMNDPARAREVMTALHELGVELAIDDFGTGFSSLGYLKLLPVSGLKIDRSFVTSMLHDDNDAVIVQSTISLAHNLGLKVVAEGVEEEAAVLRLRQLKCDQAQGYHISPPLPRKAMVRWLAQYQPAAAQ